MKRMLPIILAFSFANCSKPSETKVIQQQTDPVAELKSIIQKAGRNDNVQEIEWKDIQYDVRKTDSLVSPYLATIKAKAIEYTRSTGLQLRHEHELSLAYQDGKWVIKDIMCSSRYFNENGEAGTTINSQKRLSPSDSEWYLIESDLDLN